MRRSASTPEEDAAVSAALRAQLPFFAIRFGLLAVVLIVLLLVGLKPVLAAILALAGVGIVTYPLGRRQRDAARAARERFIPPEPKTRPAKSGGRKPGSVSPGTSGAAKTSAAKISTAKISTAKTAGAKASGAEASADAMPGAKPAAGRPGRLALRRRG